MEIERKWMVKGWPELDMPLLAVENMRQGYLHADAPVVRIRREEKVGGDARFVLCIKSGGRLVRHEVETLIGADQFEELEQMIGLPLIEKERRTYLTRDGMHLEVNHVDAGLPSEFWYAEVEYPSEEEARGWDPANADLAAYLGEDVTDLPGQSMAEYWVQTRLQKA